MYDETSSIRSHCSVEAHKGFSNKQVGTTVFQVFGSHNYIVPAVRKQGRRQVLEWGGGGLWRAVSLFVSRVLLPSFDPRFFFGGGGGNKPPNLPLALRKWFMWVPFKQRVFPVISLQYV